MDLKNQIEQSGEKKYHHRQMSRLSKAAKHAEELVVLTAQRCDARSALEAEAYAAQMTGNMLLEREVDWEGALAKFVHAQKLLEELFKLGSFEQRATCRHFLDQVEPAVRYCEYQIGRIGGKTPDTSMLIEAAGSGTGTDVLAGKLASLAAEAQAQRASSTSEICWNGDVYPVRDDRCKIAVHAARELQEQLDKEIHSQMDVSEVSGSEINPLLALFDRTINAYSEAQAAVRAATQLGSRGDDAEAQIAELLSLGRALRGLELENTIARNMLLAKSTISRFERALKRQLIGGKSKERGERAGKPEDVTRVYDTLLANAMELNELAGEIGGTAGENLMDDCTAKTAEFKAAKCLYTAHGLLQMGQYAAAAAMFRRAQDRCQHAIHQYSECQPPNAAAIERLEHFSVNAQAYIAVSLGELQAASIETASETAEEVQGLQLQDKKRVRDKDGETYLVDNWDSWSSYAGSTSKPAKIIAIPPPPELVPMRPIVLDTAWMSIEPPSVSHRVSESKKGKRSDDASSGASGMVSRLFGWR